MEGLGSARTALVDIARQHPRRHPWTCPQAEQALDDAPVLTTRRGLGRLARAAAETGARFERDGAGGEAMSWLLAPQPLFDGGTPVDECLDRIGCARAMILHGLDLPLSMPGRELDAFVKDLEVSGPASAIRRDA